MDGVTDAAFRGIAIKYGRPDIMFTEFVAVDGINASAVRVLEAFIYSESERPIVAQVFGSDPDNFYKSAAVVCALGFDGMDINMGCPDKDVVRIGSGASLIDRPHEARAIVLAAKRGIADFASGKTLEEFDLRPEIVARIHELNAAAGREVACREIPVSVKTRLGTRENTVKEWAKHLAGMELANVALHGRTLKQMYSGVADWDAIATAAEIIKPSGASVLGNGDIKTRADLEARAAKYGLDGALIGRAALGNPWVFNNLEVEPPNVAPNTAERLRVAVEHAELYEKLFPGRRFTDMRKHLAWYAHGFAGASELRAQLVHADSAAETRDIIHKFTLLNRAQI